MASLSVESLNQPGADQLRWPKSALPCQPADLRHVLGRQAESERRLRLARPVDLDGPEIAMKNLTVVNLSAPLIELFIARLRLGLRQRSLPS